MHSYRFFTLLHGAQIEQSNDTSSETTAKTAMCAYKGNSIAFPITTVSVKVADKRVTTLAVLDQCSDVTPCATQLLNNLQTQGKTMPFAVDFVNGRHIDPDSKIIDTNVLSTDGSVDLKINCVRSVPRLPINVTSQASNNMLKSYPHLFDVTLSTECADVDLLIGSNAPDCFIIHDQRFGKQPGEPYAQRFPFGWAIIGPVVNSRSTAITSQNTLIVQLTTEVTNDQLSEQLSQFWRHDFPDSVSSDKGSTFLLSF